MKYIFLLFMSFPLLGYTQTANDYLKLGDKKQKLEDHRGAIQDYTKAINLNPKYANAFFFVLVQSC